MLPPALRNLCIASRNVHSKHCCFTQSSLLARAACCGKVLLLSALPVWRVLRAPSSAVVKAAAAHAL